MYGSHLGGIQMIFNVGAGGGGWNPALNKLGAKNLLKNTATSKTINGITFTVNSDGSVTANGTATDNSFLNVVEGFNFYSDKSYKLNGCPTGGSDNGYTFRVFNRTSKSFIDYGNGVDIHNFECENAQVFIRIGAGTTCNNLTFYPMIRYASISDDTYEPYVMTNYELTNECQELINECQELTNKLSGCWIEFKDENGNPTDKPYVHWYEEVGE